MLSVILACEANRVAFERASAAATAASDLASQQVMRHYLDLLDRKTEPCPYCGRTKQTFSHKSCDGCGSSKPEGPKIHAENVYGYNVVQPNLTARAIL